MEILKDIEKNILNINIYEKNKDPLNNANIQKLDAIKKRINDYFKYKDNENNIILQKKLKYDEDYKFAREINNNNYKLFLEKKTELYNIFKRTKTLATLYEYLECKYSDAKEVKDIYTYEYINLNERAIIPPSNSTVNVCPVNKILNKKTKKCVKDPQDKKDKKVVDKDKKVVDKDKKVVNKDKKVVDKVKKVVDKDKKVVDKDKKVVDKDKKVVDKECPEGKILNPITNRCIKDVNYKPK